MNKLSKNLIRLAIFFTFFAIANATFGSLLNLSSSNQMAFLGNKLNSIIDLLVAAILILFAFYFKKNDK